jgi:hypothetical protein
MLSLILALTVVTADPPSTAPAPAAEPAAVVTKVSKMDQVVCKWRTNAAGHRMEICQSNRQWRNDQIENQKRIDDFQRRALHTQPK